MHWLFSILLIIVGALAAYTGIVRNWPNLRQGLDKIVPYQGWFGIVALVWGAVELIRLLLHFGIMSMMPALWLVLYIAANVVAVLLGLLLGYGLIAQYLLTNSPDARRKGEDLRARIAPRQVALGWVAIVLGLLGLLLPILM
ncbi:MAG TPA: hypothetical protein VGJ31_02130 [Dongiaceae bacterium]|jgi:hypothetical protein